MKNRRQTIIVILGILSLLLVTTGVSLAFLNYTKGETENSIKLGAITFKYTENSKVGNGITIEEAWPISDEQGKAQIGEGKVFDFKIEANLSRSDLEYEVVAEPTEDSTLPLDAIKFYLTDITNGTEEEVSYSLDNEGKVKSLDEFIDTEIKNAKGKTVYRETILKNTKGYLKEFRVRMWINEEVEWTEEYVNTTGAIRINVYANSNRSMASTETTTPVDTKVERVTANNKYLFEEVIGEEYQYTLTVPNEVETVDIDVIPSNMEATVAISAISKSRSFGLQTGENFFSAIVTSSDKSENKEYILRVVREKSKSTDLASLGVTGYELSPSYSNSVNIYEVYVPYETTKIEVTGSKKEIVQTVTGLGSYDLEIGTNLVEVTVTAENGTTRTIQITVNRKLSNDASINNVGVTGYTLAHLENNIYFITVPYNVESVEIVNTSVTGAIVSGIGKKENLKVSQAFIDEGLVMKRMKFGSRGHVDPIKKRTSHITIVVSDNK